MKYLLPIVTLITMTLLLTSCFQDCPQRVFNAQEMELIVKQGSRSHEKLIKDLNLDGFEKLTGDKLALFLDFLAARKVVRENAALQVYVSASESCGETGQILVFIENAGPEDGKFNHIMIMNEQEATHEAQIDALTETEVGTERHPFLRFTSSVRKDIKEHAYLNYHYQVQQEFEDVRYFTTKNRGTSLAFHVMTELPPVVDGFMGIDFYVTSIRLPHEEGTAGRSWAEELLKGETFQISVADYTAEFYNCQTPGCVTKFLDRSKFIRTGYRSLTDGGQEFVFMPLPNMLSYGDEPQSLQFEVLVHPEKSTKVWVRTYNESTRKQVAADLLTVGYEMEPQFTDEGLREVFTHEDPGRPSMTLVQFDNSSLYYSPE